MTRSIQLRRSCVALAGAITFSIAAPPAMAEPASRDLELRPWIDGPVALASTTYTLVTMFGVETPWLGGTDFAEPKLELDAQWAGLSEIDGEGPDTLSDIAAIYPSYALPALMGLVGAIRPEDGGLGPRMGRAGTYAVVGIEAITITQNVTHVVKHATRRPRPYAYSEEFQDAWAASVSEGERPDSEAQRSFPSGHAATAGAWSFALAHTIGIGMDRSWYLEALPYVGAAGITAWAGVLRVRAHKHFPTDVLVGGVLGATIGVLVPELHRSDRVGLVVGSTVDGTATAGVSASW